MADREQMIAHFLTQSGWGDARRSKLAGDASARSYDRLARNGQTAVLMNAPPDQDGSIHAFLDVGNRLVEAGFSAPRTLASDLERGFLLIEDLGDDLFARICTTDPARETGLYQSAVDLLVELHQACAPDGLPPYDMATYLREARLLVEWYLPAATGQPVEAAVSEEFDSLIRSACNELSVDKPVPVLRDYHSENLLWLTDRKGARRVGLLDYQDALSGHPAYDLVSLLEDARRDTSETLQQQMLDRFIARTHAEKAPFRRDYSILGMQRNAKILGIFVRLWVRDAKPAYIDLLPRVWTHFQRDLQEPSLDDMKDWVDAHVPAPTADVRARIREATQHET